MKRFAITGAAGYVAPRHLSAIRAIGGTLVAAFDPRLAPAAGRSGGAPALFQDEARFVEHLVGLDDGRAGAVDCVAVCSPSEHHARQTTRALEAGAHVVCEKPVVLEPSAVDALEELEAATGRRVWPVLQMRLHPAIADLAAAVEPRRDGSREVTLTYVTVRGPWYFESWKGDDRRSGGLLMNIGVHFFDLLLWLFGRALRYEVHHRSARRAAGVLELERARVSWLLSIDAADLPARREPDRGSVHRSLVVDGVEVDFSTGADDLHTRLYQRVLSGHGFGLADARPSLELVHRLRQAPAARGAARQLPAAPHSIAG
jgi:UDP-N-acetyl-2-amino-2-deoxyglucuronate dehydrogenase